MLKKAGNIIAASQRMVFHLRAFFLLMLSIRYVFLLVLGFVRSPERCENA